MSTPVARPLILTALVVALAAPALAGCLRPAGIGEATASASEGFAPFSLTPRMTYLGVPTFEPTLGLDPDGNIYFVTTPPKDYPTGVGIGWSPAVWKSNDGGATWADKSPKVPVANMRIPPETNDPYLYVDPGTGRVFQFSMAPILVCAPISFSDDGGESWITNPRGCPVPPGAYDHQTLVAAKPRLLPTIGYENVLHQCFNNLFATFCAVSLDGGVAWSAPRLVTSTCSGVTGHLAAAPDGTVYLPKINCGAPVLYATENDGITWRTMNPAPGFSAVTHDGAVAVDVDGNVYYAFPKAGSGELMLTVSKNKGATWSTPVVASPAGVTVNMPAIDAGSPGRIALAYPGTPNYPNGYDSPSSVRSVGQWHGYITISVNALDPSPTFESVVVNPMDDPFVRGNCGPGRCPGFTDFMDVRIGPDGRPYAAFVDDCTGTCISGTRNNGASLAVLGTILDGPLLR